VDVDDCSRDVDDLAAGPARMAAKELEGFAFSDQMPGHQDPLCPPGDGATAECSFQVLELAYRLPLG
jgi:hypothetical protein